MSEHRGWEDRVSTEQYQNIEAAIAKLKKRGGNRDDKENDAYDSFTNNGMNPEEAQEMLNLLTGRM